MTRILSGALGFLCASLLMLPAVWAEVPEASHDSGWTVLLSPYVWGAGLKGQVATLPPLPPTNVNVSFDDIIRHTNIGFMGLSEIRKDRFGILTDIAYINLGSDTKATRFPQFASVQLSAQMLMATVAGEYRMAQGERGFIDVIGGVRVWHINTELTLNGGTLPGRTDSHDQAWADPIAGFKGNLDLGSGFFMPGWVLAGTHSTWDLMGGVGYAFTNSILATAGYRFVQVNYRIGAGAGGNETFVWDVQLTGPFIGGTFKF